MSKKEKESSLALTPTAQIGKQLIKEAAHDIQEMQKKQIVKEVSDIMERVNLMIRIQQKTDRRLKLLRSQLASIEAGKFSFVDRSLAGVPGQTSGMGIKYHNADLNVDWSATERW